MTRRTKLAGLTGLTLFALLFGGLGIAEAAPFTTGDVLVCRVGTGSGSLINTCNQVFLDEYTPTGTLVQSIALPTVASGANKPLVASGTATSECLISRSSDGQYVLVPGYGSTIPAASSLSGTASATVPRVVGRVDAAGTVDTTTALTDWSTANNPRSVTSTNGTDLWVTGGAGGVRLAALGGTTSTQLATTDTNLRQVTIASGQLFVSSGSGATRVATVGTGIPTTAGQTITNLAGTAIPALPSPYSFFFADLSSAVPGDDTLYVADDAAGALQKFSLVSGSWVSNGVIGVNADDYRGLTGVVNGQSVTLFATRKGGSGATGGGELVNLTDASGYNAAFTGTPTVLATAALNTAFRGVALAPVAPVTPPADVPEAPVTALLTVSGAALLGAVTMVQRRRAAA